jgi:Ni2+-binding GTPase involved in maturation of urease and hydrogenase
LNKPRDLNLNKTDLLPYEKFDFEYFRKVIEMLNPGLRFFPLYCATGAGMAEWIRWLKGKLKVE